MTEKNLGPVSETSSIIKSRAHFLCPKNLGANLELSSGFVKKLYANAYLLGTTNQPLEHLAKVVGCTRKKLSLGMRRDSRIMEQYKAGLDTLTVHVESAMIKRALGFSVEELETVVTKSADIATITRTKTNTKHFLPDVTAGKLILEAKDGRYDKKSEALADISIIIDAEDKNC